MIFIMDKMTEEEKEIVEELKSRTISDVTPKMLEDVSTFYRFAKARDFNLENAETMLRKHISWRKENEIDTLLTDYKPPVVLVQYIPTTFICMGKDGSIVRHNEGGRIDMKGVMNIATKKELLKYFAYCLEKDKEMVIKHGRNLGTPFHSGIYNFEEFSYAKAVSLKNLEFMLHYLKVFFDNYPESIRRIRVINAPVFFYWAFAAVKPVLPDSTTEKMRIYGTSGWIEDLLEFIHPDVLPVYLGGNKTDPDGNPLCKEIINWGRPIPTIHYLKNRSKKLSLEADVEKFTVPPFSKEEINFEVKEENLHLEWEFETKNKDITFSLVFREESSKNSEPVTLIPPQRIDTRYESEKGWFKCRRPGNYTIVFDNSFSWIYSKEVYFRGRLYSPRNDHI